MTSFFFVLEGVGLRPFHPPYLRHWFYPSPIQILWHFSVFFFFCFSRHYRLFLALKVDGKVYHLIAIAFVPRFLQNVQEVKNASDTNGIGLATLYRLEIDNASLGASSHSIVIMCTHARISVVFRAVRTWCDVV